MEYLKKVRSEIVSGVDYIHAELAELIKVLDEAIAFMSSGNTLYGLRDYVESESNICYALKEHSGEYSANADRFYALETLKLIVSDAIREEKNSAV